MTIGYGEFEIRLRDEPTYTPGSADNVRAYAREYRLCGPDRYVSSRHGVTVVHADSGAVRASCVLLGCRGATTVHEHSAVLLGDRLYGAAGDHLCALALPDLALLWAVEVDPATCFGVHPAPSGEFLISHGELEIARVELDGRLGWHQGGRDIFTGEFRVAADRVEAEDWNGDRYRFALADGTLLAG